MAGGADGRWRFGTGGCQPGMAADGGRASAFWVIPAIDLLDGQVVRLAAGDYRRARAYGHDPVAWARKLAQQGAPRLHVVDLSGARQGSPAHLDVLGRIAAAVGVPVQFGGGLRTVEDIARALNAGAASVILGSAAFDEALMTEALGRWGAERIWAAIDIRAGRVAVGGWLAERPTPPEELAERLFARGVRWAVVTDTARDGLFSGPNVEAAQSVAARGLAVLVAGGVGGSGDVARVAEAAGEAAARAVAGPGAPWGAIAGVVVGRALYEGRLTLAAALAAARSGGWAADHAGPGHEVQQARLRPEGGA